MEKKSLLDFESKAEELKKIPSEVQSNISYSLEKALAKSTEPRDVTTTDRLMHSALSGIMALAATPIISRLILKSKRVSTPLLLANTAASMGTGYFSPDIAEIARKELRGRISSKKAKEMIKDYEEPGEKLLKETKEIAELYSPIFKKKAAFVGTAFRFGGKALKRSGELIGKGIHPRYGLEVGQKTPIRRRLLSYGVRGGLLAGAGYGTYKGVKHFSAPRSKANYTTFLRNQLLAGNVHPNELSQQDMISVRRLGMR